jgi:murein DD-endopeptidase MepM/ murein hydrolase activator NlpD
MPCPRRALTAGLLAVVLTGAAALTACTASPEAPVEGTVYPILCPVIGTVSFSNDWHAPRSGGTVHEGTDVAAPRATPSVAVVSGTIRHVTGAKSGYAIWLRGDDGHDYFYAHFDAWTGTDRRVYAGEWIGYVGDTGNATGFPHLHFEIHPNRGAAVNPYPSLVPVCTRKGGSTATTVQGQAHDHGHDRDAGAARSDGLLAP